MSECIEEIRVNDRRLWNDTVRSFRNYDVFYLNEYVTAFMNEREKNGIPVLILYKNGKDRAMNVVFKRDIALDEHFKGRLETGKYFDLSTPYGYGGFWGDISDYKTLQDFYNSYCKESGYICEFVRFELFSDYNKYFDGEVETRTHNVVRNLEMPMEEMWMDFKQKVRKNVKRANTYNLKIIRDGNGDYLEDFLRIYYSTMDRASAESEYFFSEDFYKTLNEMKDHVMYFYVEYEDPQTAEKKIISSELIIYGTENCYSYLGGTDKEYFEMRPNDFLKYEIIKWGVEKGLKNFVLGGGYGADDGIFQYKKNLAPNGVVDFYIGRKIFDESRYKFLEDLRGDSIEDSQFFPVYRG